MHETAPPAVKATMESTEAGMVPTAETAGEGAGVSICLMVAKLFGADTVSWRVVGSSKDLPD